jgi:LuxR family maltose regulon positive regulatory protein
MEETLLKTKVFIPQTRSGMVLRTRPMERFKACLNSSLVLISAPAGFGKTTLLAQWASQSQPRLRVAWISIDEGDNDPVRFWRYLVASIQTLQPSAGKAALNLLRSSQPSPVESILTALINELSDIAGDIAIILDDYHLIESKQIHDGITYLLEHMPANVHLVIATRADPPLPLAHFRGKGTMLEIGTEDLRFTPEDAALLFREMNEPGLSADDIAALNERTGGWVVGLKMAALSMRGQPDIPKYIAAFTGSHRYVMDYLMEEVLQKQSIEVRDFLLKTSVLKRLSGPLCDAVTGHQGSRDILQNLDRGHLFIVPQDEERQWYRYEHLFADLLRHQLEATSVDEDIKGLHCRAGQWYQDNGFPDEAIEHYLTAQEWEQAIRLIKENFIGKFRTGEFHTVINWVKQLPESARYEDLSLNHEYAVALMSTGEYQAADSVLDQIESVASRRGISGPGITADLRSMTAAFQGDLSRTLELGRQALAELPPESGDARSGVGLALATAYSEKGQLKQAEACLLVALEDAIRVGNQVNINVALTGLGGLNTLFGHLHKAADQYQKALVNAGHPLHTARAHIYLAQIFYEWNDLEQAEHHLEQAIELSRNLGSIGWQTLASAYYNTALIKMVRANEQGLSESLALADRLVGDESSPYLKGIQAAHHARIAILRNDMAGLTRWQDPLFKHLKYIPLISHISVRAVIALGPEGEADRQLKAMEKKMLEIDAGYGKIIARVYQALAALDTDSAVMSLAEALTMAEPEGYVRTFVDEGRLLAPLLEKAVGRGTKPEYAGRLIRIIEEEQQQKAAGREEISPGGPYEVLSEREKEVLRFLAGGFSNRQIAERLFISVGTVKTHVHNVMAKLDAGSRVQVVARARELNLL